MPKDRLEQMRKLPSPARNFFFPSQIGRLEYVARNLGFTVLAILPLGALGEHAVQTGNPILLAFYLLVAIVAFIFVFPFILLPRLRDLQWPPASSILALVPGVNFALGLILTFAPGKESK